MFNVPKVLPPSLNCTMPLPVLAAIVTVEYVCPPPTKVRAVLEGPAYTIVDVPVWSVKLVTVVEFQTPFVMVTTELPSFSVRVPEPLTLKLPPEIATVLLLTLKSRIQPVVAAVHAPIVNEVIAKFAATVIVQVTPPTQVAASSVTRSPATGADWPGAPPDDADHIAVEELSQVQVAVHTAKREAALALPMSANRIPRARAKRFISFVSNVHIHCRRGGVSSIGGGIA